MNVAAVRRALAPGAAVASRETQSEQGLGAYPPRPARSPAGPPRGSGEGLAGPARGQPLNCVVFPKAGVDKFPDPSLYTALTARRPPRRDGAPAKLLTDYSVDRRPIILGASGFDGSPGDRRGGRFGPGLFDR